MASIATKGCSTLMALLLVGTLSRTGRAIFGGGSGFRAIGNRSKNCSYGVCAETAISSSVADYGPWLQTAGEHRLAGIVFAGNTSTGHNNDGAATDADYRIFGTAASPIEVELIGADGEHPTIKSEYGVWARYATIKSSGRFMHGRTGGFAFDLGDNELVLQNASLDMEVGQSSDPVLLTGGTLKVHWGKGTKRTGSLDASFFDIARRSGGTMTSIDIDPSTTAPTISVPANTRITAGGRIQKRASVAHAEILAGARELVIVPMSGVRTTDDVVASIVSSTALFIADCYVSSDNNVAIEIQNETGSTVSAGSVDVRLSTAPTGYVVA